ncbi:MAG: type II toxin-antitoxin system RelE/ParE family toxin [bacterium]|nr:type II toxin-antitoxin system RelE/ParE family toxin [bacterium]
MKHIQVAPRARGDLRNLDPQVARQILDAIDHYARTGFGDVVRLRGATRPPEFRLRVRDWRVRFRVDLATRTLQVLRIRHRSVAYR